MGVRTLDAEQRQHQSHAHQSRRASCPAFHAKGAHKTLVRRLAARSGFANDNIIFTVADIQNAGLNRDSGSPGKATKQL
jgi:hypothetical protein